MVTWINQVSVQLERMVICLHQASVQLVKDGYLVAPGLCPAGTEVDGYLVAPGLCPAGPELCGRILPRVEGLGEKSVFPFLTKMFPCSF